MARPRGEPESVSWTLCVLPRLALFVGEPPAGDDVLAAAREAIQLAEDTGNVAALVLALEALAIAHLVGGRPGEAAAACERALAEAREHRSGLFEEASVLAHLAQARLAAGEIDRATAAADQAVEVSRRQGARVVECQALMTRGRVRRATGGAPAAVEADLDAALTLAREMGALTYEAFIREELGHLHDEEGELREALRLFTAIGATGHARRLAQQLDVDVEDVDVEVATPPGVTT
jgi:tetratricopeptide (TPR) repeat protein